VRETRTIENKRKELKALLALIPAPRLVEAIEHTAGKAGVIPADSIWKNGYEPMPFDEFCIELDGHTMFDKQADGLDTPRLLRASDLLDPTRSVTEIVLVWGKRCVAGDTLVRDCTTDTVRTIAEWERIGCGLLVETRHSDGSPTLAPALSAQRTGRDTIYKVTVAHKRASVRVAGRHQFLVRDFEGEAHDDGSMTDEEWRDLSGIEVGKSCINVNGGYSLVVSIEEDGFEDYYDITVPETSCYFDANGILHHNSGKDYTTSKLIAYFIWVLHQLKETPQAYMSRVGRKVIATDTRLDVVNVAPNADVAIQVFFNYLKTFLRKPVFAGIPVYPNPTNWKPGTDEIIFPALNLHCYSKTSKSSGLDGFNLLFAVLDEADDFHDSGSVSNADTIAGIFRNTIAATFGNFGLMANISYPRYERGYILRLAERADADNLESDLRGEPRRWFVDKATTFDIRPDISIDDPEIRSEFKNNPRGASAMFLCIPMSVVSAWIDFPEFINKCENAALVPCADVGTRYEDCARAKDGSEMRVVTYCGAIRYDPSREYFLGSDSGKSKDSFAVSIYSADRGRGKEMTLCPACYSEPASRMGYAFEEVAHGTLQNARCSICQVTDTAGLDALIEGMEGMEEYGAEGFMSGIMGGLYGSSLKATTHGWYTSKSESRGELRLEENTFDVPMLREELLLDVRPKRKEHPRDFEAVVDYDSLGAVLIRLLRELNIARAGFDAWQTAMITQQLRSQVGGDITDSSMSNLHQMARAILYKRMLYGLLLENTPHEGRRNEVKRLMQIGERIDHPPNKGDDRTESKDMYDANAIAIWLACTYYNEQIAVAMLNSARQF